jgi:hypothetical protein
VLKNEGRSTHTFTIDELGINVRLAPGETKTIEITPNKVGSYTFYCIPHDNLEKLDTTLSLKYILQFFQDRDFLSSISSIRLKYFFLRMFLFFWQALWIMFEIAVGYM